MERITIFIRTKKKSGSIRLRFRLIDGREVDLYHKSEIKADLKDLEKFNADGSLKSKVSIYNKPLFESISREIAAISKVYSEVKDKGIFVNGDMFEEMIDRELHPEKVQRDSNSLLLPRFDRFIKRGFKDGVFGEGRMKHYQVLYNELERFLLIKKKANILPFDFSADDIMDFRNFLFDEYKYVAKNRNLYANVASRNIPTERRGGNTVSTKLKKLQAFFNELEDKEEIAKSPFRKLGKERKRLALKEKYDDPVYLTKDEFVKVLNVDVPDKLQETKDVFLLQCAFGCRVGDFKALTMGKVKVNSDGIPFIHYLPQKTMREQSDYKEVETPVIRYALDIITKYKFNFPVLKYVSGKSGYNAKIKLLLQHCGIDRECKVFDEATGENKLIPLYELGSSKLCRKTHVDVMNKVQIDLYAAGLHKSGSDAVNRYTKMELKDRFALMCTAFEQPMYKVDKDLNVIK